MTDDRGNILEVLMFLRERVNEFVESVLPVYTATNWKWCGKQVTETDLIYQCHSLINLLHDEIMKKISTKTFMVAAGGIYIYLYPPKDKYHAWTGTITLEYGHIHV